MTMSQWVVDIILAIHLTRECFRWRCSCHQRLPQLNLNLYERILLGIHCTSSDTTMSVGYKIPTESLILNHSEPETIRGREVFDIFRGRLFFETTQVFPVITWRKCSKYRVAIDWFNTTYLASCSGVPKENVEALQKLHSHGFDILLLSFCGWQREQEVRHKARALGIPWEGLYFSRSKAGTEGKVD